MKTFNKILAFGALACGALAMSATASAAPVQCDDPEPDDGRYMVLKDMVGGPATCHKTAAGNDSNQEPWKSWDLLWKINFENDGPETSGSGPDPFVGFTGANSTSGTVSLIAGLTDHYLVFKYGQGSGDPDVFSFHINGMTFAKWDKFATGTAGVNGLSHVSVYGPPPTTEVPEPATLALLGLGLLGLGYRARRRQAV